jgi:5'-nucleotidase
MADTTPPDVSRFPRPARRSRPAAAAAAVLALVAGLAGGAAPDLTVQTSGALTLSVIGTTDLHGYVFPRDGRGGLAVFGGYLANLRAARAAGGGGVVLLDAGDTYLGGIESNMSEGAVVVDAFNALGYTAGALGNRSAPPPATRAAPSRRWRAGPATRCSRRISPSRRRSRRCRGRTWCRPRS